MDDIERMLLEAQQSGPRPDVRRRVLGAAMPLVQRDHSRLDRIWFSPMWRASAVLALVALIGLDIVSGRLVAPERDAEEQLTSELARTVAQVALDLGLTPADAAALAAQAVVPTPPRAAADANAPF